MLEKRRQLRTTGLQRFKKLDAEVTLVNEQQNEDLMFDTRVLDDDEVFVDVASITTASVKDSAAPTIQVSTANIGEVTAAKIDELTLAQTLIEIKAAKPKVVTTDNYTTTPNKTQGTRKEKHTSSQAQKRTPNVYLSLSTGFGSHYKQLKGNNFDEIQKLFDKEMKRVNTFVAMGSEEQENKEKKTKGSEETTKGSRKKMLGRKRAGKQQQQEFSKK
ncbi:hypothetical protein Tco_1256827 [Tanacetum coccineum]